MTKEDMRLNRLEKIFANTSKRTPGDCTLPEPGRGAPQIHQPTHLRIRQRTKEDGGNTDKIENADDKYRYREDLEKMLSNGTITRKEYAKWININ